MNKEQTTKTLASALQQAGVQDLKFTGKTLTLTEMTGMEIVRAHSFRQSPQAEPPVRTGEVVSGDRNTLCIRPNEWLFISNSCDAKYLWDLLIASVPHADDLTADFGAVA